MSSDDDGIEVRLRSYATPCARCAALRAAGAAHVGGAVLLRDGLAHLYTRPDQVELCEREAVVNYTAVGDIAIEPDPTVRPGEIRFESARRGYADLCAAAVAMACGAAPPPRLFTRPPPRRHYSRRERRRRRRTL